MTHAAAPPQVPPPQVPPPQVAPPQVPPLNDAPSAAAPADTSPQQAAWRLAVDALTLAAIDPIGLGGVLLRARAGPVRDRWLAGLTAALAPLRVRRIGPSVADDQLFEGPDLAASLAAGRLVRSPGLLGETDVVILTNAERASVDLAAKLAPGLDGRVFGVVALDEGAEPDEAPPASLCERLALWAPLGALSVRDCPPIALDPDRLAAARGRLSSVTASDAARVEVARLAMALGLLSLRAPLQALRAARALAAWDGRDRVDESDLARAAALVLGPRAPAALEGAEHDEDQPAPEPPEPPPSDDASPAPQEQMQEQMQDRLLEAVRAQLPMALLDHLARPDLRGPAGRGRAAAGARVKTAARGRPLPPRRGRPSGDARIDVVATLRAAAPWRRLRRRPGDDPNRLRLSANDIRLKRREARGERLLIFAVDASGSAAAARLAEVKGAIELLLAGAYAKRDHVCLVAFRRDGAQTILPPTRAVARARRELASLPGGGGTPIAAGLRAALAEVVSARRRGVSPRLIVLTDGRANRALDGTTNRERAADDAAQLAQQIRADGVDSVLVDASLRPQPAAAALAEAMGAEYLALPRCDAARLSDAVGAALQPV